MSNRINVEEILNTHVGVLSVRSEQLHNAYKAAIKEIVEAVVDKCAEQAKTDNLSHVGGNGICDDIVDKESILQVKTLVDYE